MRVYPAGAASRVLVCDLRVKKILYWGRNLETQRCMPRSRSGRRLGSHVSQVRDAGGGWGAVGQFTFLLLPCLKQKQYEALHVFNRSI